METRFHSWWQKAKKPLEIFCIIVVCLLMVALLVVIILAYVFNVNVPGLRGKTLWDWLQLLIIPAVLVVGGYVFNYTTTRAEQRNTQVRDQAEQAIASDNQREAALQAYIDSISELLLHEKLRESGEDDEVRTIARVRTLTVLPRLDKVRKRSVLQFLHESGLIHKATKVIDLREADLSGADLRGANLREADLREADLGGAYLSRAYLRGADLNGANLSEADLRGAYLNGANLSEADLSGAYLNGAYLRGADLRGAYLNGANLNGANLSEADLSEADLRGADLRGAKSDTEQLEKAKLQDAIMPDGTIHA
jgi:uncharacterized protein YjbI with pentapeptide repeats